MMHQCSPNYRSKPFKCPRVGNTPHPVLQCSGHCFRQVAHLCSQPAYMCYPVHRCPCAPVLPVASACSPLINHPVHQSPCSKTAQLGQTSLDPSSYRVTVRRISPVQPTSTGRNNIPDHLYLQPFRQIVATDDPSDQATPIVNVFDQRNVYATNQNTPSVPSKKLVPKNDGTHLSSTSFMTTSDDQNSISGSVLDKNYECVTKDTQTYQQSILSNAAPEESRNGVRSSTVSDETVDHQKHSVEQKLNPSTILSDINLNKSFDDTNESTAKTSAFRISESLTPAVPKSPDMSQTKSNEQLIDPPRPQESLTSLRNGKQKLPMNVSKTSLGLRSARSKLNFGLLFDDNTA